MMNPMRIALCTGLVGLALAAEAQETESSKHVNPIKGVGIVVKSNTHRGFQFALNGNAAWPSGEGVDNSLVFQPNLNVDYHFGSGFTMGLEGGYTPAEPSFVMSDYIAPFADLGIVDVFVIQSNVRSTSVFANAGYSFTLGRNREISSSTSSWNVRLGAGAIYNMLPDQEVRGTFNGSLYSIVDYVSITGTVSSTQFALKPSIQFNYWFNPWFGLNLNAQYQAALSSKDFSYTYKDVSNIDFSRPIDVVNFELYNAPTITETTSGITNVFSFGGGLVFRLQSRTKMNNSLDRSTNPTGLETGGFSGGAPTDHAINEQGLPGTKTSTNKKTQPPKESKKLVFGNERSLNPNGQNCGYPGPVKNIKTMPTGRSLYPKGQAIVMNASLDKDGRITGRSLNPKGQADGDPFPLNTYVSRFNRGSEVIVEIDETTNRKVEGELGWKGATIKGAAVVQAPGEPSNVEAEVAGEKVKSKDPLKKNEYVGHVSLIKREINPELGGSDTSTFYLEPLDGFPAENTPISVYTLEELEISGTGSIPEAEVPITYSLYQVDGRIIAVPFVLFDIEEMPSDLNIRKKKFKYKYLKMEYEPLKEMDNPDVHLRLIAKEDTEMEYPTRLNDQNITVKMTLSETQTTYSTVGSSEFIWCGVSTGCGAVFAVQVPAGTNCASVNNFFNKVCDGMLAMQE